MKKAGQTKPKCGAGQSCGFTCIAAAHTCTERLSDAISKAAVEALRSHATAALATVASESTDFRGKSFAEVQSKFSANDAKHTIASTVVDHGGGITTQKVTLVAADGSGDTLTHTLLRMAADGDQPERIFTLADGMAKEYTDAAKHNYWNESRDAAVRAAISRTADVKAEPGSEHQKLLDSEPVKTTMEPVEAKPAYRAPIGVDFILNPTESLKLDYMDEILSQKHVDEIRAVFGMEVTLPYLESAVGAAAQYSNGGNYEKQSDVTPELLDWMSKVQYKDTAFRGETYDTQADMDAAVQRHINGQEQVASFSKLKSVGEQFAGFNMPSGNQHKQLVIEDRTRQLGDIEKFTTAYAIEETEGELLRPPNAKRKLVSSKQVGDTLHIVLDRPDALDAPQPTSSGQGVVSPLTYKKLRQTQKRDKGGMSNKDIAEAAAVGAAPSVAETRATKLISPIRQEHSPEVIAAAEGNMKKLMNEASININMDAETLPLILADGRFKSQFETGRSTGMLNPKGRMAVESTKLSYAEDTDPKLRPIYSSISSPGEPTGGDSFGDVVVRLKDSVKDRATVTWADSLWDDVVGGTPMRNPKAESLEPDMDSDFMHTLTTTKTLAPTLLGEYAEAQIHGGLTVADIDRVELPAYAATKDLTDLLDKHGIRHTITEG